MTTHIQTANSNNMKLFHISIRMENEGLSNIFIVNAVRVALEFEGVAGLMMLWDEEDDNKEKEKIVIDIQDMIIACVQEADIVYELVADYFKGDLDKTILWFQTKNPGLGNITPRDMLDSGRCQKLMKFVRNSLEGNIP